MVDGIYHARKPEVTENSHYFKTILVKTRIHSASGFIVLHETRKVVAVADTQGGFFAEKCFTRQNSAMK